jgi:hypothetical protein
MVTRAFTIYQLAAELIIYRLPRIIQQFEEAKVEMVKVVELLTGCCCKYR